MENLSSVWETRGTSLSMPGLPGDAQSLAPLLLCAGPGATVVNDHAPQHRQQMNDEVGVPVDAQMSATGVPQPAVREAKPWAWTMFCPAAEQM